MAYLLYVVQQLHFPQGVQLNATSETQA